MKTRAFTLIEIMVVLSILAIIAILAYNFFGNTMKEAKEKQLLAKTYKDMQTIADAYERYYVKNGGHMPDPSPANPVATLVSEGYLKAAPKPSPEMITLTDYWLYVPNAGVNDLCGGYDVDINVQAAYITSDHLCSKWNELYGSGTYGYDDLPALVGGNYHYPDRTKTRCHRNSPGLPNQRYIEFCVMPDQEPAP